MKERIAKRTRTMLDAGLVGEVAALMEQGLRTNLAAANAIGYRETVLHLDGVLSAEAELEETINQNTWRLVRKQRKWIRTQLHGVCKVNLDEVPEPSMDVAFG